MASDNVPFLTSTVLLLCVVSIPVRGQAIEQNADGQCALLNQLQSSVIQILSTHYEYGEGIHTLHNLVHDLGEKVTEFTEKVDSLEEKVKASQDLEPILKKNESLLPPLKTHLKHHRHPNDYKYGKMKSMLDVVSQVNNLTRLFHEQAHKFQKVHNRVHGIRRSLRTLQSQQKNSKTGSGEDTVDMMSHFMKKQTGINGDILNKITYLQDQYDTEILLQDDPDNGISAGCPKGFFRNAMSCYRFENITLNWFDAEKHCRDLHDRAHLVGIETQDEQNFIKVYRRYNNAQWKSVWMWTGGNNMHIPGRWTWSGTGRDFTFTDWMPKAPGTGKSNQCVYFSPENNSQWDDWQCEAAQLNFLCEITLSL